MNIFKKLAATAAVFLAACLALQAVTIIPTLPASSAGTTNGGTALSWAITSAHSVNGGQPMVTYVNATSDTTNAWVTFYKADAFCVETYATNSTVTLSVNQTNGVFDGGVVVIRHILNDTYEKRIASGSAAAATNLVLSVAPMMPVSPGDIIYHMTATGAPAIQFTTNSTYIAASGTTVNQQGWLAAGSLLNGETTPVLAECSGAAKSGLNCVTVIFLAPATVPRPGL